MMKGTKRMFIIQEIRVSEKDDLDYIIASEGIDTTTGKRSEHKLHLIDPSRLRYGRPYDNREGHALFVREIKDISSCNNSGCCGERLIIDPPEPKETIWEIVNDMSDVMNVNISDTEYRGRMSEIFKRIRAAKERETEDKGNDKEGR